MCVCVCVRLHDPYDDDAHHRLPAHINQSDEPATKPRPVVVVAAAVRVGLRWCCFVGGGHWKHCESAQTLGALTHTHTHTWGYVSKSPKYVHKNIYGRCSLRCFFSYPTPNKSQTFVDECVFRQIRQMCILFLISTLVWCVSVHCQCSFISQPQPIAVKTVTTVCAHLCGFLKMYFSPRATTNTEPNRPN